MHRFVLIVTLLAIAGGTVAMAYSSADAWGRNTRVYKQRHQDRALVAQLDHRIRQGASVAAMS